MLSATSSTGTTATGSVYAKTIRAALSASAAAPHHTVIARQTARNRSSVSHRRSMIAARRGSKVRVTS